MALSEEIKRLIAQGNFDLLVDAIEDSQIGMLGGAILYPVDDASSDIGSVKQLWQEPSGATEATVVTALTAAGGKTLLKEFATESGSPDVTLIEAGPWVFDIWASVSSEEGDTIITAEVYKRATGGTESKLFSVVTNGITGATAAEYEVSSTQIAFTVLATDRIVIRFYGTTTSAASLNLTLYYQGALHYTKCHTPLISQGYSGVSGVSGYSGAVGGVAASGYSGASTSGYSGASTSGYSGDSGYSGVSGYSGATGTSGYSGIDGASGYSGAQVSGYSGTSGYSGSDAQQSGYSGTSGYSGLSGYSGTVTAGDSGYSGVSGYSGANVSGYSGYSGIVGISGYSGAVTGATSGIDISASGYLYFENGLLVAVSGYTGA